VPSNPPGDQQSSDACPWWLQDVDLAPHTLARGVGEEWSCRRRLPTGAAHRQVLFVNTIHAASRWRISSLAHHSAASS